jgi:hypothetical protein
MAFQIRKVQVWSSELPDRPGAAAAKLELLARAGADLEYVFTRVHPTKPDTGILFVAPIAGPEQTQAARVAGLGPAVEVVMLNIEGKNRPGLGYEIMSRLAIAGVNLRGLSLSTVAHETFAAYLAFDTADAATAAIQVLAELA